jgi:hypothetical protein
MELFSSIQEIPVKIEEPTVSLMFEGLIRDHLEHSGYFATLKALDS